MLTTRGTSERPLSDDEIMHKFRLNAAGLPGGADELGRRHRRRRVVRRRQRSARGDAAGRRALSARGHLRPRRAAGIPVPLLLILAACSGFPPFAIDTYLPGFPQLARDLDATAAQVQLTLTAFLLATAVGQLLWGTLSDQLGRRPVLLGGIAVGVAASLTCALTESIWLLRRGARASRGSAPAR